MLGIVDVGLGNVGSIQNMLKKIGVNGTFISGPSEVASFRKIILPGVGSFDEGMSKIHASGLLPILNHLILEQRVPVLGICLGMQLLLDGSEEGDMPGLGWIRGKCRKIEAEGILKVPHMGWNEVKYPCTSPLFPVLDEPNRFYFVHSYHSVLAAKDQVTSTVEYGGEITASLQCGNIYGVQFHPEKSHAFGMRLLKRFCEVD